MDDKKTIGIVDYVIFGALLLSSSLVGIYFGYKHRKRVTSAEYLLANKSMSWFTICISLVVSFFSSVGVMGITTNIYMTGVTFSLHILTFLVPIILNAEFFAPIFRRLELISVNHYLELRFSRGVRFIGCFLFFLQYVIYLAIVLYAPSLALETVADVPLMATIITTGLVCTFYTTLGGMRAVIWTDVFQSMVMVIGLGTSLVIGVINIGSFEKIYNVTSEFKRFDIDINPDPRGHQTVWGVTIGGTFSIMAAWTISQPTMQRVIAARSLGDAKKALYGAYVGLLLIGAFLTTLAIVIFATYAECDLLKSGKIKSPDQVLPYYVVDNFSHIPGVTGVFIACLFSFSISTLSSALNSLAAVFLEDIVKSFNPVLSETFQTRVSKIVACVLGVVITGLAFVVPLIGNSIIKLVIQLFGIVSGPYFGLFVLGIFFKKSNSVGAGVGSVIGLLVGIAMMVGQWFYPPGKNLPPVSMAQCTNVTKPDLKFIYPADPVYKDNIIADMVSFSYMWFGFITVVLTVFIGYLVSLCHGRCNKEEFVDKILLYRYSGCCGCCGGCCSCCDGDGETSYEPYDREVQLMMMKKDQEMEAEDDRRNDVVM